jgi:hypothetical protein
VYQEHHVARPADEIIDLITYCIRGKMPFTIFEDWSSILATVKDIVEGKTTVQEVSAAGVQEAKADGMANGKA